MIIIDDIEQGTKSWHLLKIGVGSASRSEIFLGEDKTPAFPDDVEIRVISRGVNEVFYGANSLVGTLADCKKWYRNRMPKIRTDTWVSYVNEIVAGIATGQMPSEIKAASLQWGTEHEEEASDAYEASEFKTVHSVGFIYKDASKRYGCSPDGLLDDEERGLELKAPYTSAVFIDYVTTGFIKKSELAQCQFSMWITGYKKWDFAKYDPRMKNCSKLKVVTIERDEAVMQKFDERCAEFSKDVDAKLAILGIEFGQQWDEDNE